MIADGRMDKWNSYFFDVAFRTAQLSKDKRTRVGAVIVGQNREILSVGFNGLPMGINDDTPERSTPELKYFFTEHAERNAIYHGARRGISLRGSKLYSTLFPCSDCARAIIQTGVQEVCCPELVFTDVPAWSQSFRIAHEMFVEAGIKVFMFEVWG